MYRVRSGGRLGAHPIDVNGTLDRFMHESAQFQLFLNKCGEDQTPARAPGAALSRQARTFWRSNWRGKSLMAIGMKDPVLGPPVMRALHADIRGCPPPLEIAQGGHFLQEWGESIARIACDTF